MPERFNPVQFRDPDGNVVEFIERRDAGFAESVGGYFQGISEVGIATGNVSATTTWLSHRYGLRQFTKCSPQPDSTPSATIMAC